MKRIFSNKLGYTIVELLLVTSLLGVIPISIYLAAEKSARAVDCISNLRNIYIGIQLYEADFERLPDAKFYPQNPAGDPKSILNVLSRYIDDKNVFNCTAMPVELKKKGLTYIWNDTYNNSLSGNISDKPLKWLMSEMTAADTKIPPPHNGMYNVLFLDGHAASVNEPVALTPLSTPAHLKDIFPLNNFAREKSSSNNGRIIIRRISMYPKYVNL